MVVKSPKMRKRGQVVLVLVSIIFTLYQHLAANESFFTLDFFIFTAIAWFVGFQIDLGSYFEQKARLSEESYRLLVDSLPEPIFIHHKNKIIYVNKAAVMMMGANSTQELIGRSFGEFIAPEHKECWEMRMSLVKTENKPLHHIEYKMMRLDQSVFYFEVSCLAITFDGKNAVLALGTDITERKEITSQYVQKSEKMAMLGQMSAGIAHEIRNPLTAIKGFIQLLKSDDKKNEYLEIVLSEIERINTIVGEFLFLAKPTADVFQKKNIKNIINDVVTFINAQSNLYNTQIYTMMEDSIPMIYCEENRLKQVFLNLLQNSIEAMPNGGIIAITVKMMEGEQISIQIADQGMGIEEERLATLGEPFYTTKEKGTGLGLMTCYKIIEEGHRGRMSIDSTVGKGTTVQIILPSLTQEMLGTSIHTKFVKE